jgi:energy-coupling factor transporter ATP-binding protein EcfA2
MESVKQLIYTVDEIKELYNEANQEPQTGLYSGINGFDNIARFDLQQLVIFTAKAGSGKSTFLNFYAYMMNKTNNMKTLFISFEGSVKKNLLNLTLLYNDIDKVNENSTIACTENIQNLADIETIIAAAKDREIVIIDPFNYIPMAGEINTYTIGSTLREFKRMAKQYNKLMVLVAHPSKASNLIETDYPTGADIMGSVNFNNMADAIIGMSKLPSNKALFGVAKLRNNFDMGLQGATVTLDFDFNSRTFSDGAVINTNDFFDTLNLNEREKETVTNYKEATPDMIKEKINKAKENEK